MAVKRSKLDISISINDKEKLFKINSYVDILSNKCNIEMPEKTRNRASVGRTIEFLLHNQMTIDEYLNVLKDEFKKQEQ